MIDQSAIVIKNQSSSLETRYERAYIDDISRKSKSQLKRVHVQFLCVLHVCKLVYVVVPDVEYGENVDYRGVRTRSCALDELKLELTLEYRGAQA